ncbi:hypothetical protein [Vasconcelosia minhoensis]|nr:hypothetical protein [Romeria gracilis]
MFDRAFESRQTADYLVLFTFEPEQVEQLLQDAAGFVQEMHQLLNNS